MSQLKKALLSIIVSFTFYCTAFSQGNEAAIKQYNYENYRSAVKLLLPLLSQQPQGKTDEANGENFYYLGNAYCYLGKWDSARAIFTQGTTTAPKYPQNFCGLAKTYLNENNTTKALDLFEQAKSFVSKKDVMYYVWVADAYINNSKPNTAEAINQLKNAIAINYKVAAVYMELGDAYFDAQTAGDAINNYELALQNDPSLIRANCKIGDIWADAKKYNESLAAYQKCLSVDPNYPPALKGLAQLYLTFNLYDKAKSTYDQYLKVADLNDDDRYTYAQLIFLNKDYTGSLKLIHDLMKRDSSKAIMFRLAGYSDYEQGSYDLAFRELTKFFMLVDPKKILASDYEYMGKVWQKKGNDSMTIIYYQKTIDTDSSKKSLYGDMAQISYAHKKYKDAAKYYGLDVKNQKNPSQQISDYYKQGLSYYLDSLYKKADTSFINIIQISPNWTNPLAYLWRARSNMNMDSLIHGPALPYYQKVIEISIPDSVKYQNFIQNGMMDSIKYRKELIESFTYFGNYYLLNGKYDNAEAYYNKVLALDPNSADVKKNLEWIINARKAPKKKP